MRTGGPIAIIGGTSRIAQDFVLAAVKENRGLEFVLYGRRPEAIATFLKEFLLPPAWLGGTLRDFAGAAPEVPFAGVLNFVGVGDPAKSKQMGSSIFEATLVSDELALAYLERSPETRYLFLSSGAVYGTDYSAPVSADTPARLPVNALHEQHHYSIAKLHAEGRHRGRSASSIIDIRVFNYVSRRLSLESGFLLTEMIRAALNQREFVTADDAMVRDYLHPEDFSQLVFACLAAPPGTNRPVDAYSRQPINKIELIDLMAKRFGMEYRFVDTIGASNISGAKPFYYSKNKAAAALGYEPKFSSAEAVAAEVEAIFAAQMLERRRL